MQEIMTLPLPENEEERLANLDRYQILDTMQDPRLDELTTLAASIFNVPIVLITILDKNRQWFKSNYGLNVKETARSISFCQYTIMEEGVFEVEDASVDDRFKENPLVLDEPNIRFYCGAPLEASNGFVLGSLGLIDSRPRKFSIPERKSLSLLAKQVVDHFELHREKINLEKKKEHLEEVIEERTREISQKLEIIEIRDKKLNELNNELKTFIYKSSHDLRGPIKTMIGLTELALNEPGEDTLKAYLTLLLNTEVKLDHILDSLLEIVAVKSAVPKLKMMNPAILVRQAFADAERPVKNKDVEFILSDKVKGDVISDPHLIHQAVCEIIRNGIQYNHNSKAKVEVSLAKSDGQLVVAISDNGSGIPDAEKEHVFDMFYKNRSTGSGLGLYLAKNAVERLGGDIQLSSEKLKGSTFTLKVPVNN